MAKYDHLNMITLKRFFHAVYEARHPAIVVSGPAQNIRRKVGCLEPSHNKERKQET